MTMKIMMCAETENEIINECVVLQEFIEVIVPVSINSTVGRKHYFDDLVRF